jgi:hypothetical protein
LPAVGITVDRGIEEAEAPLGGTPDLSGQEDGSGAGPEQEAAALVKGAQSVEPGLVRHQVEQGRALAAGDHEGSESVELANPAHRPRAFAEAAKKDRMCREVPLQGEDANRRAHGLSVRR